MSDALPTGKAAKMLGVSRWTLKRWAKRGRVETIKLPKGEFSFKKSDLSAFIAAKHRKYERTKPRAVHMKRALKPKRQYVRGLLAAPKIHIEEKKPEVAKEDQTKPKKRFWGFPLFRFLTIGSAVIAAGFLGLAIYLKAPGLPESAADILGVTTKKASIPVLSTLTFRDIVMAAATDSADASAASVQFFLSSDATPETLLSENQPESMAGNAGYIGMLSNPYAYDESPFSYLSGAHGPASPVAVIADAQKLRQYPFFANVDIGDKLFIYKSAGKALVFRPLTNEIIAFGTLDEVPAVTYREIGFIILLRNGTGAPTDMKPFEEEVKYVCKDCTIVDSEDAGPGDYRKTLVIDVTGTNAAKVKELAYNLRATVSELPATEYRPPAGVDILILMAKDRAMQTLIMPASSTSSATMR